MRADASTGRGFTLLELMTVIALTAMIAGIGAVGLSSTTAAAKFDVAAAAVLEADSTARHIARRFGPTELRPTESGGAIVITAGDDAPLRIVNLPRRVRVTFHETSGQEVTESVRFDARGRGPDYRVHVHAAGRSRAWWIAGLTGWASPAPEAP